MAYYMRTSTGKKFYPARPTRATICIEDIANGLAGARRYASQGFIDKHYSVAEHSCLMSDWARDFIDGEKDNTFFFCLLMHDAAEAYCGDLARAVKATTGPAYKDMEHKIESVIFNMYGIGPAMKENYHAVKQIDIAMVPYEVDALFLEGVNRELPLPKEDYMDLPTMRIRHWSPVRAKAEFLKRFEELYNGSTS